MSATSGDNLIRSRSCADARQRRLRRTLQTHGVLTREGLYDLSHAENWRVPFGVALTRAIRAGRVRRLAADLYEAGPNGG